MSQAKTQKTSQDPREFLDSVADVRRRADAQDVMEIMIDVTGEEPAMWGTSIVGFGSSPVTYANGSVADWPSVGFSPRKANLVIYLMDGFAHQEDLLSHLGPHKVSKACLYLKSLAKVDLDVLRELIASSMGPGADSAVS